MVESNFSYVIALIGGIALKGHTYPPHHPLQHPPRSLLGGLRPHSSVRNVNVKGKDVS